MLDEDVIKRPLSVQCVWGFSFFLFFFRRKLAFPFFILGGRDSQLSLPHGAFSPFFSYYWLDLFA